MIPNEPFTLSRIEISAVMNNLALIKEGVKSSSIDRRDSDAERGELSPLQWVGLY
jgi:L-fucose isomerase-like protein